MKLNVREIVLFAILGTILFISKVIMEPLPNIHSVGMLTMLYTLLFRKKALIPLYVFVILNGLLAGFNVWWIPYLYIWTPLWAVTMLLPRTLSFRRQMIVYPVVCGLHGLLYGVLYAPVQALFFGLDLKGTIAWIAAGLPFDAMHAGGNFVLALLIPYLLNVLRPLLNQKLYE